jgi:hypothetical protein
MPNTSRDRTSDDFARLRRELFAEFHLVHQEARKRVDLRGGAGI